MISPPDISIVIPARDEIESLPVLHEELRTALDAIGRSWEVIVVDDGSRDGSAAWLRVHAATEPRLRPLCLARSSGQSGALAAGLAQARGAIVVTMDADLQNDPADLPRLLAALERAEVVSGVRVDRQDSRARRVASRIANTVRRMVIGDRVTDIGCSLKAYRRDVLTDLPMFQGVHRFLPALCVFRGARLAEVSVAHRPRRHGRSKYGILDRLGRGLHDLLGVRWIKSRLLPIREVLP